MKDWLVKLAEETKSEDEVLHDIVDTMPKDHLRELVYDLDYTQRPTQLDSMQSKIADAERMGRELAHEHGNELVKEAFLPLVAGTAARLVGGQALKGGIKSLAGGVAKNMAKDMVVNGATKAVSSAVRPPTSMGGGPMPAASGGFNYGKVAALNMAGIGRQAAGFFHRNPGAAVTLAGAGVGALMAPRDPQTGQKQYMRGALMGGGLAAGANALSQGRIADKAKHMVTRQSNPVFGQGARRYMTESAYMTRPGAKAAPAAAAAAPAASEAASAVSEMPRAYSNPDWQKFQQGAQEHVEMGQLRNQMASKTPQKSAPPRPAATRVGPSFMDRFKSPASVGGAAAAPSYQGGPVAGQVKVAEEPKTDLDRARKWGRTGALAGLGYTAAVTPGALQKIKHIEHGLGHKIPGKVKAIAFGGGAALNAAQGYGIGRLAHRVRHGKATGKPLSEKTAFVDQVAGGFIGHHYGKQQAERGEKHTFGGKQIASLLLPGGIGYQIGRHMAHKDHENEKTANRQTLVYDPATKTFTRVHQTADTTMGTSGNDLIPAGHSEPVARGAAGRGDYAGQVAPAGARPAVGGTAQTHVLHGGDVLSSTPRPGMAARPANVPPPVPAAAKRTMPTSITGTSVARPAGGIAGLGAAAAKPKAGLPSLAGAVSLVGKK